MHQPHDKLYRKFFSHPKLIQELLTGFVEESFVKDLDFSGLKKLNVSYITDEFKKREADIIYEIQFKGKQLFIYLLLELQSTVDQFMADRLLQYIRYFIQDFCTSRKADKFPPVFPLVLYNGDKLWDAPMHYRELFQHSVLPKKFIPDFTYCLVEINRIPKRKLLEIRNALSALFYIESSDRDEISEHLETLVEFIRKDLPVIYPDFLTWFFKVQDIALTSDEVKVLIREKDVSSMFRTKVLKERETLINESFEKGIEKGIEKGEIRGELRGAEKTSTEIAKKMKARGINEKEIAEITGLSLALIRKL